MGKILFVTITALAIFFSAGCTKQKTSTPSIADTSAKQMQPADDQAQATPPSEPSSPQQAIEDQNAQPGTQDQSGLSQQDKAAQPQPQDQANANDPSAAAPSATSPSASNTEPTAGAVPSTTPGVTPGESVANNAGTQLDDAQNSQAQIPALPDASSTNQTLENNSANPSNPG